MSFELWIPHLPPSSNKIYIRHPKGQGKILSANARKFKLDAMGVIQKAGRVAFMTFKNNVPYQLTLALFLEAVENKASKTGERYKQIDLSNRVKLIEDTVAEATGIDDRHNFRIILEKHCDPENPGVFISLTELPEGKVGLTKELYENCRRESDGAGGSVPQGRVLVSAPGLGKSYADRIAEQESGLRRTGDRPRRR